MRLLEVTPAPCIHCGKGNTPNTQGDLPRFVDLERDVNWDEPVIICEDCVMHIGGLMGMLSEETRKDLLREVRTAQSELHDIQAKMDQMRHRAKRLGVEFTEEAA
jgi:hypothetical protein